MDDPTPCPICGQPGGFHDPTRHVMGFPEKLKAHGWQRAQFVTLDPEAETGMALTPAVEALEQWPRRPAPYVLIPPAGVELTHNDMVLVGRFLSYMPDSQSGFMILPREEWTP